MRRSTFLTVGGAAALAGCGHAGSVLPALTSPAAAQRSEANSASSGRETVATSPAYPLPKNPILGEVRRFDGATPPTGWSLCDGSVLAISANQQLFSILGKMAGGDGKKTFALPKKRNLGRVICTSGEFITTPKMLAAAFALRAMVDKPPAGSTPPPVSPSAP